MISASFPSTTKPTQTARLYCLSNVLLWSNDVVPDSNARAFCSSAIVTGRKATVLEWRDLGAVQPDTTLSSPAKDEQEDEDDTDPSPLDARLSVLRNSLKDDEYEHQDRHNHSTVHQD
jgi:hypothetical protein